MELIKSVFEKKSVLNIGGLISFFFTLYFGGAGLWIFFLCVLFIAGCEYFFRFFNRGIFTPYLLMLPSPLLLIHYSSGLDFRIRMLCFILLAFIMTAAATPAAKKINLSLMNTNAFFVWLTAFGIFALAALLLYVQGIHLSGDEPHYIMITQSIVEDGDFDLKNNMEEKTYYKYLPVEIKFHGGNYKGKYYSFHTPGVSFLLVPFFWLFGLLGKLIPPQLYFRLVAAVINAFFALGLFTLLKKIFPQKNITAFWLFFIAVFPLIFHSIHLYPELPAATAMMYGYIFAFSEKKNYLLAGLFLSLIPWFHIKYIPALIFLTIVIIYKHIVGSAAPQSGEIARRAFWKRFWPPLFTKRRAAGAKFKELFVFFLFPVISLLLLMIYTKSLYGSVNPADIFPSEGYFTVPILARIRTLFAYFFDQRDGLLFYAPLFFLAFFGLKRKFTHRGILLGTAATYILFHANTTLRGAYSPAGRPLMFVSWIFIIFIVNYYYSIKGAADKPTPPLRGTHPVEGNSKPFIVSSLKVQPAHSPLDRRGAPQSGRGVLESSKTSCIFRLLTGLSLFVPLWLFYYPLFVYQPVFSVSTERAAGLITFFGGSYIDLPVFFPSFLSVSNWNYAANYVWLGFFALALIFYYLFPGKIPFLKFLKKRERVISFLLFILFAYLLCFYPHIHLISRNKFSNKKIAFFNNSKNFFHIEGRDVFRIKAGNNYDIFFDLKKKGNDSLRFDFLNTAQVDVTVRNGNRILFDSPEHKEGKFSLRLSTLRKMKVKDRLVAHIGIETGPPADINNPFLFLKIE